MEPASPGSTFGMPEIQLPPAFIRQARVQRWTTLVQKSLRRAELACERKAQEHALPVVPRAAADMDELDCEPLCCKPAAGAPRVVEVVKRQRSSQGHENSHSERPWKQSHVHGSLAWTVQLNES